MIDPHYLYLLVNLGAVIVPFIFSFHPKIKFYKQWGAAAIAILGPLFLFLPWDMYFTKLGVWGFNPHYTTGLKIVNLPVEEVLFFICIPYACLFTWFSLKVLVFTNYKIKNVNTFSYMLAIVVLLTAFLFKDRYYTFSSLFLLGIALLYGARYFTSGMHRFFISYLILLIGFFAVNGILTGTGLEQPVVWYNNAENLGIRAVTIPLEDFFYGMLLILLNIMIFEKYYKSA